MASAARLGLAATADPAWREADLGEWENLAKREVVERYPDVLASIRAGEDPPFGDSGERISDLVERVTAAMWRLAEAIADDEHAVVVTHGGVIQSIAGSVIGLGYARPSPLGGLVNTSVTTVRLEGDRAQIVTYNDDAHLLGEGAPSGTTVVFVRHGESEGNVAGRWQGRSDGQLTSRGRRQAELLAGSSLDFDYIYTSPLSRAKDTADAVGKAMGIDVEVIDNLAEFDFGEWEDLAPAEIEQRWPDQWFAIYREGRDLPRGFSGESFTGAADRMRSVLHQVRNRHPGERVGLFTHGGVTRAFVARHLGLAFADRYRVSALGNTSLSTMLLGERFDVLSSWNLTPHLE